MTNQQTIILLNLIIDTLTNALDAANSQCKCEKQKVKVPKHVFSVFSIDPNAFDTVDGMSICLEPIMDVIKFLDGMVSELKDEKMQIHIKD